MKFKTISGSVYELNQENKQIRRLEGVNNPTPRQGPDGQWKTFEEITPIEAGKIVVINWRTDHGCEEYDGASAMRTTMTSPVAEIITSNCP